MNLRHVLLGSILAVVAAPAAARAQRISVAVIDSGVLQGSRLNEASGITPSSRRPGVFWTHNDSGDGPFIYATDSTGADLGKVRLVGATTIDWEAISSGPCTVSTGTCLFIGDIGDNNARRPNITIYVVPEPAPPGAAGDSIDAIVEDTITLRYPDRPHDAEAMAVIGGWLYIITKDRIGAPVLFRSPTRVGGPRILMPIGPLAISTGILRGRLVTDMAASPDGQVIVARTYVSLHFFSLHDGVPTALLERDGLVIPVVEAQGEGLSFEGPDHLVLIGERGRARHAVIARLQITGLRAP